MPTVILIPGLLCNRELWSSQISALKSYAETIVPDITQQTTISEMAAAVLEKAPTQFSLAGFSLGSQIALEIMNTARHRVQRLALLSTTRGGLLPATEAAIRRAIVTIEEGGFERYLDEAYFSYFAANRADQARLRKIFLTMARAVGPRAGIRQMEALLAIRGPFVDLDQIRCPTVIIGGREDRRTTPEAHQELAREIPGSEIRIIDGAAHFTPIERPEEVAEILCRWISL